MKIMMIKINNCTRHCVYTLMILINPPIIISNDANMINLFTPFDILLFFW